MPDRRQRRPSAERTPVPAALPSGPVPIATGTVELVQDRAAPAAVTVLVNGVPSSHLDLEDPTWLEFEYMQQMAAFIEAMPAGPLDAVHLGAGACAMPRWLDAVRPGSRQVAVDVDAELLTLVRTWFALPRSPALRLRPGDARQVLTGLRDASADVVVRDVFAPDRTPADLCTAEFVGQVARVLRPGGLYLANCADRPPLELARREVATAREVFDHVALVAEPGQLKGRRYGNLVVVAHDGSGPDLSGAALGRRLRSLPVPVRMLHGPTLLDFVGRAPALRDAAMHDTAAHGPPRDEAAPRDEAG